MLKGLEPNFRLTHICSTFLEYPCLSRTLCGIDNDLFSDSKGSCRYLKNPEIYRVLFFEPTNANGMVGSYTSLSVCLSLLQNSYGN